MEVYGKDCRYLEIVNIYFKEKGMCGLEPMKINRNPVTRIIESVEGTRCRDKNKDCNCQDHKKREEVKVPTFVDMLVGMINVAKGGK